MSISKDFWSKIVSKLFSAPIILLLGLVMIVVGMIAVLDPYWVLESDGYNYYKYLRSLYFDGDIYFQNENLFYKEKFNASENAFNTFYYKPTETGYYGNPFPIGVSIFETPFLLIARAWFWFTGFRDVGLPGFSIEHAWFLGVGNIIYGFVGLFFLMMALRHFFSSFFVYALAIVGILFGTPLVHSFVYMPLWSHLLGFVFVTLFVSYFLVWFPRDTSLKKYAILGMFLGVNFLIRWQSILLIIILIPAFFDLYKKESRRVLIGCIGIFLLSLFLVMLPQLISWKMLYGHYVVKPPSNTHASNLLNPQIVPFLFSSSHGMFAWTPLYLFSLAGLIVFARRNTILGISLLVFLFAEIYVNSAISDWWGGGGGSFGARRMLDYSVIFAIGLGTLGSMVRGRIARSVAVAIIAIFVLINLSLMVQSSRGWLDRENVYNDDYKAIGLAVPHTKEFIFNTKRILRGVYRYEMERLSF